MQQLGPKQTEWIRRLRSGEYTQITHNLRTEHGYCCLGVATEMELGEPDDCYKGYLSDGSGAIIEMWRGYDTELPEEVRSSLKFYYSDGGTPDGAEVGHLSSLASLNDKGKTFAEIADLVEANPHHYFEEPV